ncbi:hypothetical protein C7212DRAFT_275219 [Tuber magnatum]|uniref:MHYT domain-containing protein n=1 Tax=Tuber magnatum TaxID=42249 RepID=A0A317SWS3_9PEZI|nr:hypothetical protein C7212DRAFT_275219 [Tuber magnatum]
MFDGEYNPPLAPQRFAAGYIILSYFVSFLGSLSTLELLQRRTSQRGLYNWYLLLGSSVTMGGVAIWSMHFVGNRSIVIYPNAIGTDQLQLAYSSTFTALSFFVPILVLFLAYLLIGTNEDVGYLRLGFGGTFAGLSICGMHYLGQSGIENYRSHYAVNYVVASIFIAVSSTIGALAIFFILRKNFTNNWYKRALCAMLLSSGVSGMHWCASVGTRYQLREDSGLNRDTRNATVIITIVLSVFVCVLLLAFAVVTSRARKMEGIRAQKIVLASATFDHDGKLMVLPDGTLPIKEVTDCFQEKSFEEALGKSHPVFHWIYQTTRNWKSLSGLIEGMREHLRNYNLNSHTADFVADYSFVFREMFCIAAQDLADGTHRNLDDLGVLYDEIITTGVSVSNMIPGKNSEYTDVEAGHGKGKILFLIKKVAKADAANLTSTGYRFTDINNVLDIISRSTQVPKETLTHHLNLMRTYNSSERMLQPGVHVGCFAVRANVNSGFEILVHVDRLDSLPTAQLSMPALKNRHIKFLKENDGVGVGRLLRNLDAPGGSPSLQALNDPPFVMLLKTALERLISDIEDPFFTDSTLVPQPIAVPCQITPENGSGVAIIIVFKTLMPVHARAINESPKLDFVPFRFFSLQQRCFPYSADHDVQTRNTHREFSGKAAAVQKPTRTLSKRGIRDTLIPWPSSGHRFLSPGSSRPSTSSEKKLVTDGDLSPSASLNPFTSGGIMVSQSVSVERAEAKNPMELQPMGPSLAITVKDNDQEMPTWVDILFKGVMNTSGQN